MQEKKININNYEIFIIDYLDGNLNDELTRELMIFLDQNPKVKEDFEGLENVNLPEKKVIFDKKNTLKKPIITSVDDINEENYEEYFIAHFEGDLSEDENKNLSAFIMQNAHLTSDFLAFKKTKFSSEKVIFENKKDIYKKNIISFNVYRYAAVAACLVLMIGFGYRFFNIEKNDEIANNTTATSTISNNNKKDIKITNTKILENNTKINTKKTEPLKQNIRKINPSNIAIANKTDNITIHISRISSINNVEINVFEPSLKESDLIVENFSNDIIKTDKDLFNVDYVKEEIQSQGVKISDKLSTSVLNFINSTSHLFLKRAIMANYELQELIVERRDRADSFVAKRND